MNAIMNEKGRQTKLLAAIAMIAMVVCVFAAVMPSVNVSAVAVTDENNPFTDDVVTEGSITLADGVYTVSKNTTIDLSKVDSSKLGTPEAPLDVRFEISNGATLKFTNTSDTAKDLYITHVITSADADGKAKSVFYGGDNYGTVAADGKVNIHVALDKSVTDVLKNCHVLYNVNVNLDNAAVMTVSQAADVGGQSYWIGSTTTLAKTTVAGGSQLVFSNANGISGVEATVSEGSAIIAENNKTGKAWLNFSELTVSDATSSVQVKDGSSMGVYITTSLTNNGTVDTGAAVIGTADNATITNNATGKISAAEIQGTNATITNSGELDAKAAIGDAESGYTYLSGAVSKDTLVAAGATLENVTVNPGVTLTLAGDVDVKGDMRLYGTIATNNAAGVEVNVTKKATLTAYAGATVAKGVQVVGTGKIDLSAAMSTVTLNDDIESDFKATQSQKVVIADTLTIKSGYEMTILGELVINEGCTVIIEDGASLILGDSNVDAKGMTVNGTIEVEQGGEIRVESARDVTVVGEISSSGTVYIDSNVTIKNGGRIVIDDSEPIMGTVITAGSSITVESTANFTVKQGGELSVAGDMTIATINNQGVVTLDGANIIQRSNIHMTAADAVVDIKSFTQNQSQSLIIDDIRMYLYTDKSDKKVYVEDDDRNIIAFDGAYTGTNEPGTYGDDIGVRNIKITASVTSETVSKDVTNYYNSLVISGSVAIYDNTDDGDFDGNYAIKMNANNADNNVFPSIEVPESLTIGKNVKLTLNGGEMNVDGTVTATAEGALITSHGEIYVNGMITTDISAEINDGINAFHYTDDDYNYYTTLKTSVDNGATDIEYIGSVTVLDSVTIPAGTEVTKATYGVRMTIGDGDHRDVVVTFTDGATMRSSVVNVMGTLVFDNNKTGNRNNNITSDVIIDEEPKRTYTNIYTALSNAADGSTITIAPTTNVYLDKDAEIRETITLEVPAGSGLYLYNDVTLTVNGTLKNSGSVDNAYPDPDSPVNAPSADRSQCDGFQPVTSADDDRQPAAIVANGTVMSMTEMEYGYYYIAGAYYQMIDDQGSWYYITPVEQAAAVSNDVENGEIEIFGENTVTDITFTGDKNQAVEVTVTGTLNAGTITLDRAGIIVNGAFTGTAASAAGSVDVVNATGFSVVDTYVDETEVTYLDGTPVAADAEQDSSVTIATGTVNAGQIEIVTDDTEPAYIGSFAIESGATLMVSGKYVDAVASINASEMTVNGTLTVNDGGEVTVTDLTVRGTFNVMSADDEAETDAGVAEITNMYVGIAKDDKTGKFVDASAAAVNSDETIGELNMVYVSGESTVTGKMIEKMKYTQFFVEDALWMTVYTVTSNIDPDLALVTGEVGKEVYSYQPGDLNNSEFSYWADSEGEKIVTADKAKIGDADYQQVYANLNYNIYTVTVFADPGITAVYIDGKLMPSGYFQTVDNAGNITQVAGFQLKVAAGEHEITYKLGNYFSGEADMTVNGSAVDGNKFTTSGTTTADKNVTIYLQGIEASAPETPSTTGGDDGMGLTDYLLIILVVLIVIMAIIVALRLMRS